MFHHRSSQKATKPNRRTQSKGRVETTRTSVKKVNTAGLSKQDRLNCMRQIREQKKEELLTRRRLGAELGDRSPPPKVIVLVAFHTQADSLSLKRKILEACGHPAAQTCRAAEPAVVSLPAYAQGPGTGKPRVLLIDPPRDVMAVMDVAKCADVVLCVLGPYASLEEPSFDALGYKLLTALKSQGLPAVLGAVHGPEAVIPAGKKAAEAKKFVTRYFNSELGAETKLLQATSDEEVKTLVRGLGSVTPKDITWRSDRGYMLAQEAEYLSSEGVLRLRGYVRGPGFRCRHLSHLTGHGDFVVASITVLADPCPTGSSASSSMDTEKVVDELKEGDAPDMQRLQPYDPTTAEQTWPSPEELGGSAGARKQRNRSAAIPAPGGGSEGSDRGDAEMGDGEQAAEGAAEMEGADDEEASVAPESLAAETEEWDVSSHMTMEVPTTEAVAAEKRRREVLLQRSQEELEFPDEVDTPLEVPARERFQKYRGLKSFRTSPWDPYEDLPVEYSRIWEFEAFAATARAYRQQYADECEEIGEGGVAGLYCMISLRGVSPAVLESQPQGVPFILSGLFGCEQKVSVVHSQLTRVSDFTEVVKSKQEVIMHCGFRRFPAKPTFSEIPRRSTVNRKFKFLRFLHPEVTACASFYAPVVFPPCRLMMFAKPDGAPMPELAAMGAVTNVDPKQLIIKRIALTGYPFRTHKSKGVVRFMFFNPADIRWFKPVELATKKGLRGHIVESLGTHGYMKCRFSAHIKQDDTVYMNLYKRVYPKWYPPAWGGHPNEKPDENL